MMKGSLTIYVTLTQGGTSDNCGATSIESDRTEPGRDLWSNSYPFKSMEHRLLTDSLH